MKISIKPETPLTPLNQIFPDGVPVVGDSPLIALDESQEPCWILNQSGLERSTLNKLADLANSDAMPIAITFTVIHVEIFPIPQEWVA
jgi:hypothetical protein